MTYIMAQNPTTYSEDGIFQQIVIVITKMSVLFLHQKNDIIGIEVLDFDVE